MNYYFFGCWLVGGRSSLRLRLNSAQLKLGLSLAKIGWSVPSSSLAIWVNLFSCEVVFLLGYLPVWSSSFQVVYLQDQSSVGSFSSQVTFQLGYLLFMLSSSQGILILCCRTFRLSSFWVILLSGRFMPNHLPIRYTSCQVLFLSGCFPFHHRIFLSDCQIILQYSFHSLVGLAWLKSHFKPYEPRLPQRLSVWVLEKWD